jgi:ribonuclease-3
MSIGNWLKRVFTKRVRIDQQELNQFQALIGYQFTNRDLLTLALTHRSLVRAGSYYRPSNERLEFLGDSVLGLVIAHKLYQDHPDKREGDLTKLKAMLVSETALFHVGTQIGLNRFIHVSQEEEKTGGRERASIVSDAFESVIGAVYLDGGLEPAREVVLKLIYSRKTAILADTSQMNYKGDLLELTQSLGEGMPRYDVVAERGPDHEKTFHVVVRINGDMVGEGWGLSKKEAEQRAACMALECRGHTTR